MSDPKRCTCAVCTRTDLHTHGGVSFQGYMMAPAHQPTTTGGDDVLAETPENVERVARLMTIGTLGLPFRIDEDNAPNVAKRILAALRSARTSRPSTATPSPTAGLTRENVEKVARRPGYAVLDTDSWQQAKVELNRLGYPHWDERALWAIAYYLAWSRITQTATLGESEKP